MGQQQQPDFFRTYFQKSLKKSMPERSKEYAFVFLLNLSPNKTLHKA